MCNDVCQCSLLKADSVLLTKHGGMEWGFELSSATLAVISSYEEMVIGDSSDPFEVLLTLAMYEEDR